MRKSALVALLLSGCLDFSPTLILDTSQGLGRVPSLAGSVPADGDIDVDGSGTIVLTFSEPLDRARFTAELSPAAPFTTEFSSDDARVTLTPSTPLAQKTAYRLLVTAASKLGVELTSPVDINFVTRDLSAQDFPAVTATSPVSGDLAVAAGAKISVTFSRAMATGTFVLNCLPSYDPGAATWNAGQDQVTFNAPAFPFADGTHYVCTVDATAQNGKPVTSNKTFAFTVPDITAPTVTSTPADGALGFAREGSFVLQFSEPMNKTLTEAAVSLLLNSSPLATGTLSWSLAGDRLTVPVSVASCDTVTLSLAAGATDLAGNPLAPLSLSVTAAKSSADIEMDASSTTGVPSATCVIGAQTTTMSIDRSGARNIAFIDFTLAGLPADTVRITGADVRLEIYSQGGLPFDSGPSHLQSVFYGSAVSNCISAVDLDDAGLPLDQVFDTMYQIAGTSLDVTSKVAKDWELRATRDNHSQFRLLFLGSGPGAANYHSATSGNLAARPHLTVTVDGSTCP